MNKFSASVAMAAALGLSASASRAELSWETRLVQHSAGIGDEQIALAFKFSNVGKKPTTITDVKAACGCTAPQLTQKTYAPGESGQISVVFDAKGLSGMIEKTIDVTTDASPSPTVLTLRVNIPSWIEISRRLLWWRIGDKEAAQETIVTIDDPNKVSVRLIPKEGSNFEFQGVLEEQGKRYRVIVTPRSTNAATQATAEILAEIPGAEPRRFTIYAHIR